MWGGYCCVYEISSPQVRCVVPVRIKTSEKTASGNDEGLKMCVRRPSFSHRISSLAAKPRATNKNCRKNQSGLNQRKRLMLKMIGNGPNPRVRVSRRDQASSASKAYAKTS